MAKRKKHDLPQNEEALKDMERDNEIVPEEEKELKHPHEITAPVGEDERDYEDEELNEQGYTEEGKDTDKTGDEANPHPNPVRKIA